MFLVISNHYLHVPNGSTAQYNYTCSVYTSGYLTFNYTGCTVHSSKNQIDCYEAEAVID